VSFGFSGALEFTGNLLLSSLEPSEFNSIFRALPYGGEATLNTTVPTCWAVIQTAGTPLMCQ
jgi:hypothetical protein